MTFLEKLGLGGSVALIGIAIVFVGLVLLIFLTVLMSLVVKKIPAKKSKKKKPGALPEPQAIQKNNEVVPGAENDDEQLIAVLTAAVAVCMGTPASGLVIRSVKRIHSNLPAWNRAGRSDVQLNKF